MSAIAIIPARGGSKRIPRKNIKEFCGKPMIARSIEEAVACGCFARVVVSTDDEEIADVARNYGAEVPFIRPSNLSDDHTATIPVIQHAINWMQASGHRFEQVCCIYATAPFISREDLGKGLALLRDSNSSYVFPVTSYAFPIQRAVRMLPHGQVEMFSPELFTARSQDLEEAYHDAGQFYWGAAESWLMGIPIFSTRSRALVLPRYRVQDIDTVEDWERAELLFKSIQAMQPGC